MSAPNDTGQRHSAVGQLLGNYVIKAVLGEGGMGEVFEAEHQRLGRRVALKRLKKRFAENRKAVKRFVDEAWAIGQIQHANIVKVTDFVLGEQDVYYIMELLEGATLADELRRSGVLAPQRAVHIAVEVAAALSAVHAKGFVHGDIKPSNIFLVQKAEGVETVKLLDFGIARLKDSEPEDAQNEPADAQLVTPVYMSPEQANRQPTDGAADLYSLGVVLYHMLAGAPPFDAATFAEYVYKHTQEPPKPLGSAAPSTQRLSAELQQVVHRCLKKEPSARFPSAQQLGDALEASPPQRTPGATLQRILLGSDKAGTITRICMAAGSVAMLMALFTLEANPADSPPKPTLAIAPSPTRPTTDGAAGRARAVISESVTLRIESQPSRALVKRLSPRRQILGLTPLVLDQVPSAERWQVEVRLPGYKPQLLQISLTGTVHRLVRLIPEPPATGPPSAVMARPVMARRRRPLPRTAPPPVDPRGIIDPFNEEMK